MDRSYEFTTTMEASDIHSGEDGGRGQGARKYKKGKGKSSKRVRHVDISDTTSPGEVSSDGGESMSRSKVTSEIFNVLNTYR